MNSYAWDTAIVYIQNFTGTTNYSYQISKNKYLANTGENEDEICKINDMASNVWEYTTEYSTSTDSSHAFPCTDRGGYYGNSNYNTSYHGYSNVANIYKNGAFRVLLYI